MWVWKFSIRQIWVQNEFNLVVWVTISEPRVLDPHGLCSLLKCPSNEKINDSLGQTTRSKTIVYHRITCVRITIVYNYCVRSPHTVSVLHHISPSTTVLLRIRTRRHTIVIRAQVIRRKTIVYDRKRTVDSRSRPSTEFVILDLGYYLYFRSG